MLWTETVRWAIVIFSSEGPRENRSSSNRLTLFHHKNLLKYDDGVSDDSIFFRLVSSRLNFLRQINKQRQTIIEKNIFKCFYEIFSMFIKTKTRKSILKFPPSMSSFVSDSSLWLINKRTTNIRLSGDFPRICHCFINDWLDESWTMERIFLFFFFLFDFKFGRKMEKICHWV